VAGLLTEDLYIHKVLDYSCMIDSRLAQSLPEFCTSET
jgi:hypothetical protein